MCSWGRSTFFRPMRSAAVAREYVSYSARTSSSHRHGRSRQTPLAYTIPASYGSASSQHATYYGSRYHSSSSRPADPWTPTPPSPSPRIISVSPSRHSRYTTAAADAFHPSGRRTFEPLREPAGRYVRFAENVECIYPSAEERRHRQRDSQRDSHRDSHRGRSRGSDSRRQNDGSDRHSYTWYENVGHHDYYNDAYDRSPRAAAERRNSSYQDEVDEDIRRRSRSQGRRGSRVNVEVVY